MKETSIIQSLGVIALIAIIFFIFLPLSFIKDGILGAIFFLIFLAKGKIID